VESDTSRKKDAAQYNTEVSRQTLPENGSCMAAQMSFPGMDISNVRIKVLRNPKSKVQEYIQV